MFYCSRFGKDQRVSDSFPTSYMNMFCLVSQSFDGKLNRNQRTSFRSYSSIQFDAARVQTTETSFLFKDTRGIDQVEVPLVVTSNLTLCVSYPLYEVIPMFVPQRLRLRRALLKRRP